MTCVSGKSASIARSLDSGVFSCQSCDAVRLGQLAQLFNRLQHQLDVGRMG